MEKKKTCSCVLLPYDIMSSLGNPMVSNLVAIATVSPDSTTKWAKTSQHDVKHGPSVVSVTSLMTSSRQVRCCVTSFSRHYDPKRTFFVLPGIREFRFFDVLGLFIGHACAH